MAITQDDLEGRTEEIASELKGLIPCYLFLEADGKIRRAGKNLLGIEKTIIYVVVVTAEVSKAVVYSMGAHALYSLARNMF